MNRRILPRLPRSLRRGLLPLAAAALLGPLLAAGPAGRAAAPGGVHLLAADDQGLSLRLITEAPRVETYLEAGQRRQRLVAAGLGSGDTAGRPDLPMASVLVALPPQGEPRLSLEAAPSWELLPDRAPALRRLPRAAALPDSTALLAGRGTAGGPAAERPEVLDRYLPTGEDAPLPPSWWPDPLVRIAETGWLRGQRVARLEIAPLQWEAAGGRLRLARDLRLRLDFGAPAPAAAPGTAAGAAGREGPLERVLDAALVNADQARAWRANAGGGGAATYGDGSDQGAGLDGSGPAGSLSLDVSATPVLLPGQALANIGVDTEAMVRVDAAALAAAGVQLAGADPRQLRLYRQGVEQAVLVEGEGDGSWDGGDALVFYGQPSQNRYDRHEVYQLRLGGGPGLRMAERDASPGSRTAPADFATTHRFDFQKRYVSDVPYYLRGQLIRPEDLVDRWYSDRISVGLDLTQRISGLDAAPGSWEGTLRLSLIGKSSHPVNPDHKLRVLVGGQQVGADLTWDGNRDFALRTLPVPAALLQGAEVEISFVAPGGTGAPFDQFYVDWLELDYRRRAVAAGDQLFVDAPAGQTAFDVDGFGGTDLLAFDLRDAERPVRLTGLQAQAGAPFLARWDGDGGAGRSWVGRRGALRAPAGLKRRQQAQVQQTVVGPPAGADYLIVSHADFLGALAPLVAARQAQGHTVALIDVQDIYDVFSGGQQDAAAIQAFVRHAYLAWPQPRPYYLLLVGDGSFDPRQRLAGGNPTFIPPFLRLVDPWLAEVPSENAFVTVVGDDYLPDLLVGRLPVGSAAEAQAVVAKLLAYQAAPDGPWRERLLFVADDADSGGAFDQLSDAVVDADVPARYTVDKAYYKVTHPAVSELRTSMLTGFGQGYLLAQYVGHGQPQNWAAEGLLRSSDSAALTNSGALPVWLEWTCLAGSFHIDQGSSISEAAVRNPGGGAIAAFAPAGFGVASGHDYMNSAFVSSWLRTGVTELGALTLAAKLNLYRSTGAYHDLIDTYHLMGDPALKLALPAGAPQVEPSATPPPTAAASATPPATATPLPSATATAIRTATVVPTASPTPPPSATALPTATRTATAVPSATPPLPTASPVPGVSPSATAAATATVVPSATATAAASATALPSATAATSATPPATATVLPSATVAATASPPPSSTAAAATATAVAPTVTASAPTATGPQPSATPLPLGGLSLGNLVFADLDGDGRHEPQSGEMGIDGVRLSLYRDSDGSGTLSLADERLAGILSTGGGVYRFAGLPDGDYLVAVDAANFDPGGLLEGLPSSWGNNQSGQAPDPDNDVDGDDNGSPTALFGVASRAISLRAGQEPGTTLDGDGRDANQTLDFGFQAYLCLGDRVFRDGDDDGVFRPVDGEYGLAGLPLRLYADSDGSGDYSPADSLLGSQTSAVAGRYRFCGLVPGAYLLRVEPAVFGPGGAFAAYRSSAGNEAAGRAPDPDDDRDHDDNGYWDAARGLLTLPLSLSDAGEPGQERDGDNSSSNLTLDLGLAPGQAPTTAPPTASPRPSATRTATAPPSATALPTGVAPTATLPPPTATPVAPATSEPSPTVAATATERPEPSPPAPVAELCLGDQLFYDLDNDGAFEPRQGEFGLAGVRLELLRDLDLSGGLTTADPVLAEVATGHDGHYRFCGLPAGDYLLHVSNDLFQAGGLLDGMVSASGNDQGGQAPDPDDDRDDDDNGQLATDGGIVTRAIRLAPGQEPPDGSDGDDRDTNATLDIGVTLDQDPTAAQVWGLTAVALGRGRVEVRWSAGAEQGLAGYRLLRAVRPAGPWRPVGDPVEARASQDGAPQIHALTDQPRRPGLAYYRLELIRADGRVQSLGPVAVRPRW